MYVKMKKSLALTGTLKADKNCTYKVGTEAGEIPHARVKLWKELDYCFEVKDPTEVDQVTTPKGLNQLLQEKQEKKAKKAPIKKRISTKTK